jgi:hypothetical protein
MDEACGGSGGRGREGERERWFGQLGNSELSTLCIFFRSAYISCSIDTFPRHFMVTFSALGAAGRGREGFGVAPFRYLLKGEVMEFGQI